MSSVDSKLYLVAVKEAQAAVELDESGQYRKAINKYHGVRIFSGFLSNSIMHFIISFWISVRPIL